MKKRKLSLWLALASAAAAISISYATCYTTYTDPQCVSAGMTYGQCTPQGCSQSTGLIATQAGYETGQYNVYSSGLSGGWKTRTDSGIKNMCYVSGCKVWNNCTQRYEYSPINGCSCDAAVTRWVPGLPNCP